MAFKHLLLCFIFVFSVSACTAQKLKTRDLVLEGAGNTVVIKAEIAESDEERSQGLMHRTELADGEGMLFVFTRDEMHSFWMKNTLIPLSIAFISRDGRIMEIRDMEPHSIDPVRSSRSVRYALEVPQGWFERVNIRAGDRIILDNL